MAKAPAKATKKKTFKKKEKRVVHVGLVHSQATFNTTIVTISDPDGNTGHSGSPEMHGKRERRSRTRRLAGRAT